MPRFLAALLAASAVTSFALADIAPPPPPKGKKYVNVTSEVKLGKDVKGYVFVLHQVTGPGAPKTATSKVELSSEKATTVIAGGRRNYAQLFAVPEDKAKEFKTDKDLFDAVTSQKVKGVQLLQFGGTATLSDTVKGDDVTWTYTITGIDEKGIKTDVTGDGSDEDPRAKRAEPKKRLALFEEPSYLIGGVAAAVAVTLGGLWLVRRKR